MLVCQDFLFVSLFLFNEMQLTYQKKTVYCLIVIITIKFCFTNLKGTGGAQYCGIVFFSCLVKKNEYLLIGGIWGNDADIICDVGTTVVFDTTGVFVYVGSIPKQLAAEERLLVSQKSVNYFLRFKLLLRILFGF